MIAECFIFCVVEQAVKFFLDYLVTLAGMGLQASSIQRRDVTAAVTDQAFALQISGRFGDAFAAHAEHAGNQLLRYSQFIGGQPIKGQQQPAT